MSSGCGNCDCSDQSQCVKKGYYSDIIETEKISFSETMGGSNVGEGDCKCGSGCSCGSSCGCNGCGCCK